ncbi:T9SS C-terminal target domain-containing protein [Sphingobacterium chuzhouense]|uniref:T9SS C-terminal target domain-containing protein n=1 Tax=Sphingobacterium chuzhouense TaxID=1742264 RepID=A0ABR7XN10_9SPHI|nr:T9SS C-terminal target domain-containing protein [Sphingobacterium chuzhouense]MBD1420566.1 T9SS C-terminal target domain-containing protein [Sphingobacterium chuzhouense]
MKRYLLLISCLITSLAVFAQQKPVVKVDLNESNRRVAETNESGYSSWQIKAGTSDSFTEGNIKITFVKVGSNKGELASEWYKTGMGSPHFAYLVSDGIALKDGDAAGKMEMRISGLPEGENTLLTYHNIPHSDGNRYSPIVISHNGKKQTVQPSVRALKTADAVTAYTYLNVKQGGDAVVVFEAADQRASVIRNLAINAFEINTPNAAKQAQSPSPGNADEHVELQDKEFTLTWEAAPGATRHEVYFGLDSAAVADATPSSSEFKGQQSASEYTAADLYSMDTYYWRVDEITNGGKTKGNVWYFKPAQLAFPEAEGYGRYARGGRGGIVVEVTNLNDSGPGSLREAVENHTGPRTIVFAVSGIINLKSRLVANQPYVTIAGQTAPGKGICIAGAPFGFTGDDVVAQYLRVRLGAGKTADGMGLTGANYSIVDHCSISWTIDEAFSSRGAKNITLQRTLISEALNTAGHSKYEKGKMHGYAASIGGDIGSFHHNLLAHCYGRNWSLAGGLNGDGFYSGKLDLRNNVVYNWGGRATDGGAQEVNFVNNYYKPGAGTTQFFAFIGDHENVGKGMQRCYFAGNVMPGHFDEQNQEEGRKARYSNGDSEKYETFVDEPFFDSKVTTHSARLAYKLVLSDVGNNQPGLDEHDQRIIQETIDSTYSATGSISGKPGFPDHQDDVGGYDDYPQVKRAAHWDSDHDGLPDLWELHRGLNPNSPKGDFSDTNLDTNRDGYTELDYYLQWMSKAHFSAVAGESLEIDLKELAKGFTQNPIFKAGNAENGTVSLKSGIAVFKPSAAGVGSFEFTVTDAEGDSMTRQVNILSGT